MKRDKKKDSPSAVTLRESWNNLTKAASSFAAALKDHAKQTHTNWIVIRKANKSIRMSDSVIKECKASQRDSAESIRLSNYVIDNLARTQED